MKAMGMPHTREPWEARCDFGRHWISAGHDIQIADVSDIEIGAGSGSVDVDAEETQANAERIVACVNACKGISTAALTSGALRKLFLAAMSLNALQRANPAGIADREPTA